MDPRYGTRTGSKKARPSAGLFWGFRAAELVVASPRHIDVHSAKRAGDLHGMRRGIPRRCQVDGAGLGEFTTSPGEASLVGLRLQSGERAVDDVQLAVVLDVRIAGDRDDALLRLKCAARVSSRGDRLDLEAVRCRIT